ncbi:PAS domain S-box-containing protein [Pseudomonas duriflava]|uniref:histidine kinase n=1 Tax=Pseudomonas duriflava TaxID=459528 RepID=A0A562Q6Z8_9PSED|nr:response regulator [Pseudomonas duriflava]TWI52484.1 PAS domain S-box-containing protein [Pseudomonas duriflava]
MPARSSLALSMPVIFQTVFLIDSHDVIDSPEAGALKSALESHGVQVHLHTEKQLGVLLDGQDEPAVIVFMPSVEKPVTLGKAIRSQWTQCALIFVKAPERVEAFHRELGLAPMLGAHWSIVAWNTEALPKQIRQAATNTRQRVKWRTTLNRANDRLMAMRTVDGLEYQRLQAADHYLAAFINSAQEALVGIDTRLDVLYWSAGAEELFGVKAKSVIGQSVRELPFWASELEQSLAEIAAGARVRIVERPCLLKNVELALEIMLSGVKDDSGALVGTSLTIRDMSARVAEQRAQEAFGRAISLERQHLYRLFEQAPGFVAITKGMHHQVEIANRAFYQLVGRQNLIGRRAQEVFPSIKDSALTEWLDRVYSTKRPYIGQGVKIYVQPVPDQPAEIRYIDFIFQPVLDEGGVVSGIFFQGHDVTAQTLAQEELRRSRENLQTLVEERTQELERSQQALHHSQKMEAIGKLTGGVAHDFNNVLQIIEGNLELLRPELSHSASGMAKLENVAAAVVRGARLSSQLLAFARRQPLKPIAINLSRLLRSMDDLLRRALGETIEIETVIAGGLWTTMVDPNQLENVILNLAINARDAMKAGGKLTLELSNAMLDDHYVRSQTDIAPGQYVLLAVSDTGSGMSAETLERAFEPFFTTKPEGEGTGLGLSMAYGFVKQSSGHIRIYSELGCGTTIKLYLPRTHEAETLPVQINDDNVVGGNETILVVEDDLAVQATVIELLVGLGYKVLRANDAQSALSILQSGMPIDLLFTDVVMPGALRSPDLARQAKQLLPNIAVLFTSGYTQNAIVHGGRLDPGVELLSKPYRLQDLARKVRQLLTDRKSLPGTDGFVAALPVEKANASQVLVLEDQPDILSMTCELVELLGYSAQGFCKAEEALHVLEQVRFDILLTDVNLPGMSGIDFARQATRQHSGMRVIFMSGEGDIATDVPSKSLAKPFNLQQLKAVLEVSEE